MQFLLQKAKFLLLATVALGVGIFGVLCTQTEVTKPDGETPTTQQRAPILKITSPGQDTSLASESDSFTLTGTIDDPDLVGITEFSINGANRITDLNASKTTFTSRLPIAYDTNKIFIIVTNKKGQITADTILISRNRVVAKGKASIEGTLYKEASPTLAKARVLKKTFLNAQGTEAFVESGLPASGADIMAYDAKAVSTSTAKTTKTDSLGNWKLELDPGNYFIFAVYFDRENFKLVTTSLPDVQAKVDSVVKTPTQTAVEDDIQPSVYSFLDATQTDSNNIFISTGLPKGSPIALTFSEPMNRPSAGDSSTVIILGEINPESVDLRLIDTIKVIKKWSPTGKELIIEPGKELTVGKTYRVIIPTLVKDLALNKCAKSYSGIFKVVEKTFLEPFKVLNTSPKDGDTIGLNFPVEFTFSRPVNFLSLANNFTITPKIPGYFEGKGPIARFINKEPWARDSLYTIQLKPGLLDLLGGDSLGTTVSLSFRISKPDTFEQKTGAEGKVAAFVKGFMDAFIAGNFDVFAAAFHSKFEMIEYHQEENREVESRMLRDQFLQNRREDAVYEAKQAVGFPAPAFYYLKKDNGWITCWKLVKGTKQFYLQDFGGGSFNGTPGIFNLDSSSVNPDSIKFIPRGVVVRGDTFIYVPQQSTFINENTRNSDPSIFGKLLAEQTNVQTNLIKMITKYSYNVKSISTADNGYIAMMELRNDMTFVDGKRPYSVTPDRVEPDTMRNIMAIQAKVILESNRFFTIQMVVKNLFSGAKSTYTQTAIADTAFKVVTVKPIGPINIVSPAQKSLNVGIPVKFVWNKSKETGLGGYIFAISNEISGGAKGLLIYTRDTSISINGSGVVEGGTVLNIGVNSFNFPLVKFMMRLDTIRQDEAYVWKVVGVPDTTSANLINYKQQPLCDTDFGRVTGRIFFTPGSKMPTFDGTGSVPSGTQPIMEDRFADSDGDFVPDWIERALRTNPFNNSSWPNFMLDNDKDGFADFIESDSLVNSNPNDSASKPADLNGNKIPDALESRPEWRPELSKDDDKDGFPNEIEYIFKTDPWNAMSKPQPTIRPVAPYGTYRGFAKLQNSMDNGAQITITVYSSNGKDSILVDSTRIPNLMPINLRSALTYEVSEWVFRLPITSGPNAGKLLKMRFRDRYQGSDHILDGIMDMTGPNDPSGPYVGNFFASTSGNMSSGPVAQVGAGTVYNNPTGVMNFGPPPSDLLMISDSLKKSLSAVFTADTTGRPTKLSLIMQGSPLTLNIEHWQIGAPPFMRARGKTTDNFDMQITTNQMFKLGDTIIMNGMINIHSNPIKDYNYLLFRADTSKNPTGKDWVGFFWSMSAMAPPPSTSGSLPFIGTAAAIESAVYKTQLKAVMRGDTNIFTILKPFRDINQGNIWMVKDSARGKIFYVMEDSTDRQKVWTTKIGETEVMVLQMPGFQAPAPGGTTNPTPGSNNMAIFFGDSMLIADMLARSNDSVNVNRIEGSIYKKVRRITLRKQNEAGKSFWAIKDFEDSSKTYIFMGTATNPLILDIKDNKPSVVIKSDFIQTQPSTGGGLTTVIGPTPFTGDSAVIFSTLSMSGVNVFVQKFDGLGSAVIKLSSVKKFFHDGKSTWIAADSLDSTKAYYFLADPGDNSRLQLKDGKPLVNIMNFYTGGTTNPGTIGTTQPTFFAGDSNSISNALRNSNSTVYVSRLEGMIIQTVNLMSIKQTLIDNKRVWVAKGMADTIMTYIFMAEGTDSLKLALKENRPIVTPRALGGSGTTVPQVSSFVPFIGDSLRARGELALAKWNTVIEISGSFVGEMADSASLRKVRDPKDSTKTIWIVSKANDPFRYFMLMANSGTPYQIAKRPDGRIVVTNFVMGTQPGTGTPGTGTQTPQQPRPWSGDSTLIRNLLTQSNNACLVYTLTGVYPVNVNPSTLQRYTLDGKSVWLVKNIADSARGYFFYAEFGDTTKPMMKDLKPVVGEKFTSNPGTPVTIVKVPCTGDSLSIREVLVNAQFAVAVETSTGLTIESLDPGTFQRRIDPRDQTKKVWSLLKAGDQSRLYILLADQRTPQTLLVNAEKKPIVYVMSNSQTQPTDTTKTTQITKVPFTGDSVKISSLLVNANWSVWLETSTGLVNESVDPGSLAKRPNPRDTTKLVWSVTKDNNLAKIIILIADQANPLNPLVKDNKPVAFILNTTITQPTDTTKTPAQIVRVPCTADSAKMVAYLTNANWAVWVETSSGLVSEVVDPTSLMKRPDPREPSKLLWSVLKTGDQSRMFAIIADQANPIVPIMKDGKPITIAVNLGTTGTGGNTQVVDTVKVPYTGDSTTLVLALNTSANMVVVLGTLQGAEAPAQAINLASLRKEAPPTQPTNFRWVANLLSDANKSVIILGERSNPTKPLIVQTNKVAAMPKPTVL